jgi:tryptophanyl-tRNA synthetase
VKRVLSGIQPTSESFHLGNYLGAVKQWVELQSGHETYYAIVDLHALTGDVDPKLLRARTLASAAQLIAVGINTETSSLFVQSHLPEHNQLGWLMECVASFGEASRMTQFKDKSAKGGADALALVSLLIQCCKQQISCFIKQILFQSEKINVSTSRSLEI